MRLFLTVMTPVFGLLALGACAPSVPDAAAGVGFGDPVSYLARQQAQAAPTGLVPPRQVVSLPPQPHRTTVPVTAAPQATESQSIASAAVASVRPGTAPAAGVAAGAGPAGPPGWSAEMPNVTAYALSTTHRVGTPVHPRSRLTLQNTSRNCAEFASADLAQEEFLRRGGPARDPLNLDPDGDGFACGWSPEPFRAAARATE